MSRLCLNVLLWHPGSRASNSTSDGITERSGLERSAVQDALPSLEERDPPLVRSDIDATLNQRVWFSTYDAVDAFDDQ
jgi:hypothetical protein